MDTGYLVRKIIGSFRRFVLFLVLIALFLALGVAAAYFAFGDREEVGILPAAPSLPVTGGNEQELGNSLAQKLTVNAQLQVNGQFYLAPSQLPDDAKPGTLVFDQATSTLQYYDGTGFVSLTTPEDVVIPEAGVTSLQGQTGAITLTPGVGIAINGTTITSSGILGVNGVAGDVSVTTANGIASISLPQSISPSASPAFNALSLTNALPVSSGGTGTTSLAANGVLVGNGAGAITSVATGVPGQCLISTAGAPTFGACAGGGSGVSSLNGLVGNLILSNATGVGTSITIDDASTTAKGIAQFNSANFSVAAGVVNTIQNIGTSATPTFAGLTLSAPLSVANGGTGAATLADDLLLIGNGTGAVGSVANGTPGQCLVATSGAPIFTACTGDGVGMLSLTLAGSSGTPQTITDGNTITIAAGSNITTTAGATDTVTIATVANPNFTSLTLGTALGYGSGGTNATTAQGAINNLSGLTTQGDLLYHDGANSTRLARGTNGQCLVSTGSSIEWATCTGAGGVSSVNTFTGAITVQGTANQIVVNNNSGVITLSTPQDINTNSSPTFSGLTLTSLTVDADTITDLTGTGLIVTGGALTVDTSSFSGNFVNFHNGTAQIDNFNDGVPAIWIDQTANWGDFIRLQKNGTDLYRFQENGEVYFGATSKLDAQLQIRDSVGITALGVDTNVGVGGGSVYINEGPNINAWLNVASSASANSFTGLRVNNRNSTGNIAQFLNSSVTALTISAAGQLSVGTSDTTGQLLVLDTKTDAGDPSGVNGGMYYNGNTNKLRCYENGAWVDCISSGDGVGMSGFTLQGSSGTPQAIGDGDTVTIAAGTGITTTAGATGTVTVAIDSTVCTTSGNCIGGGTGGDILQGGNSFGTTMTIGTNDAESLVLETNNTPRLTIDSAGAGTYSGHLDINNTISAGSVLQVNATSVSVSDGTWGLYANLNANPGSASSAWYYGARIRARSSSTNMANGQLVGLNANTSYTATSSTLDSAYGATIDFGNAIGANSTIGTYRGLGVMGAWFGSGSSITNYASALITTADSAYTTRQAGIWITDSPWNSQPDGDWAIYSGVTDASYLGGALTVAGNLAVDTDTFFVDSANDRVGIGTNTPGVGLDIQGYPTRLWVDSSNAFSIADSGGTSLLYVDTINGDVIMDSSANGQLAVQYNGNNILSVEDDVEIRSANPSAFSVRTLAGTRLFNVDSALSGGQVEIGLANGMATQLVLDTKNTAGDPTGVNGGMYYNSDAGKFRCYEAGAWVDCIPSGSSLFTDGGTATYLTSTTDELVVGSNSQTLGAKLAVVGTADQTQLLIRANATQSGANPLILLQNSTGVEMARLHTDGNSLYLGNQAGQADDLTSNYNTGFGYRSLNTVATGTWNTGFGGDTLFNTAAGSSFNTAVGVLALTNNGGDNNTGIGVQSLGDNSGSNNAALGRQALQTNSGNYNTAVGNHALSGGNTGDYNIGVGYLALTDNTSGVRNVSVGVNALANNTIGNYNLASGNEALMANVSGSSNVALGYRALRNSTGSNNISIGFQAGDNLTAGSGNIMLGHNLDFASATGSNQLNIAGLLQSTDYTTGAIDIATSGAGAINIGAGTSTGTISIGSATSGNIDISSGSYLTLTGGLGSNDASIQLGNGMFTTNVGIRFSGTGIAYRGIGTQSSGSVTTMSIGVATGDSGSNGGQSGNVAILSGNGTGVGTNSGNITIDTGSATGTAGTISLGATNTSAITLGNSSSTISFGDTALANCGSLTTVAGVLTCGGGGGSSLFTDAGDYSYLTSTTDELTIGSTADIGGKLNIVGTADQSQLLVRANATQSSPLIVAQDSTGTELFRIHATATGNNLAFGNHTGQQITTGTNNFLMGTQTGWYIDTGTYNTAVGHATLRALTSGTANTALGYGALYESTDGRWNVAIGDSALRGADAGDSNTAVGYRALLNVASDNNTALGRSAGELITSGNNNVLLGARAGDNLTTGSGNVILGYNLDAVSATGDNQLNIAGLLQSTDYTTGAIDIAASGAGTINVGNNSSGDVNVRSSGSITLHGNGGTYGLAINSMLSTSLNAFRFTGPASQKNIYTSNSGSADTSALTIYTGVSGGTNGTSGDLTIGSGSGNGTNTSSGDVILDAGSATGTAGTIYIGNTNASGVEIGNSLSGVHISANTIGVDSGIVFNGSESQWWTLRTTHSGATGTPDMNLATGNAGGSGDQSGDISILSGNGTGTGTNSGNITIDVGTATGTAGTISLGATNASGILLGTTGSSISFGDTALANCSALTTVAGVLTCGTGGTGDVLQNGNSFGVIMTIGTNDAQQFNIETNALDRIRVSSGGTVIIDPTNQLLVVNNQNEFVSIGTTTNLGARFAVVGVDDETQLLVRANATQTSPLIVAQASDGSELFSVRSIEVGSLAMGYQAGASLSGSNNATAFGAYALNSLSTGIANTAVGFSALRLQTSGHRNTAIGDNAMRESSTGNYNTAVGQSALYTNAGDSNTGIGASALEDATGSNNTAVGTQSLQNASGSFNTAVGMVTMQACTSCTANVALGYGALNATTVGSYNVAVGDSAIRRADAGSRNVGIGFDSLENITSGNNTAIGYGSGNLLNSGANNVLLGYRAGDNLTTGSNNVILGYDLDAASATGSNQLNIAGIIQSGDYTDHLAVDTDTLYVDATNDRVGIGTATPYSSTVLHVSGTAPDVSQGRLALFSANLNSSTNTQGNAYFISVVSPGAVSAENYYGTTSVVATTSTNLDNSLIAATNSIVQNSGAGTLGWAEGLRTRVENISTGTINNASGLTVYSSANVGGGTITDNYGINVGMQTTGVNNYGVLIQGASTYALWVDSGVSRFDGDVVLDATLPAGDTANHVCRSSTGVLSTCTSSARFKDNVANLGLGLNELRQLQPVSYTWNTTGKQDVGFIAEQVAAVIPQAVTYDENGEVASFNYNTISALLTSAVKELDLKVQSFETRLIAVEQGYFAGNITVGGKIISAGNPATAVLGAQAAGSSTIVINGNDTAGNITYTTSTNGLAAGEQIKVEFSSAYDAQPRVTLTPASQDAAAIRYYVERTETEFTIHFIDAPNPNATYEFDYQVIQ